MSFKLYFGKKFQVNFQPEFSPSNIYSKIKSVQQILSF